MINIGDKYQHIKDGEVYDVLGKTDYWGCGGSNFNIIEYKDQQGEIYVRTEKELLNSFKPYEPVKQEFMVTKHGNDIWEGWSIFHYEFEKLKRPMMYKITVEEIF